MGAETFGKISAAGTRKTRRARVLLTAKLHTPCGEVDARLRDISSKGALLECAKLPPPGSEVVFKRGPVIVPATVAWSGAGRVGLEFVYEVDEKKLLVQMRKAPKEVPHGRWSPPLFLGNLSNEAKNLARAWGVTVGINLPEIEG